MATALIYTGVLLPALGFFDIFFMRYAQVADHFQYHASCAVIALATAGAATAVARRTSEIRRIVTGAAAALLVALAALSYRQTFIYHDLTTLWSDVIAKNPKNWMPYANLAEQLDDMGRYDEASDLLERGIELCADSRIRGAWELRRKRGFVLMESARYAEAEAEFAEVLATRPFDLRSLYGLGMALASLGRWDEAQAQFQKALDIHPNYADGHSGLATVLKHKGQTAEAIKEFRRATELAPGDPIAHFDLANLLALGRDYQAAAQHYQQVVTLQPGHVDALHNLGFVLVELGKPEQAVPYLRESLRLRPLDANARATLEKAEKLSRQRQAPLESIRPGKQ